MRSHAITSSPRTYFRLLALALVSTAIAVGIPYFGETRLDNFFSSLQVNIGILFAIVIGFLIMIGINRKQAMDVAVGVELNKIRRLHHLAWHLHKASPGTAAWFKSVDKAIFAYLKSFKTRDFLDYTDGDKLARAMTYTIYALPQKSHDYNEELYDKLLDAAASLTEARERIRATKDASIGYFQWLVTIGMTLLYAVIMAAATPFDQMPRTFVAAVIFTLFVMLQLIYEYDQTNPRKRRFYSEAYVENAKRLS